MIVDIAVDLVFQPLPEKPRVAVAGSAAAGAVLRLARDRRQISLHRPQNFTYGVILGGAGQAVAARFAHGALNQVRTAQRGHDGLQVLFRELLTLRDIAQAMPFVASVLGHIQHDPQSVAPFC